MALGLIDLFRGFQIVILILGIVIIYFASKGYRKTKSRAMLFLSLGFLFVTLGAGLAGLLYELLIPNDLLSAETIVAGSQVIGFGFIVYSILGTKG